MRGISAYRSVRNQSASPEKLLVMLYERAIQDQGDAIAFIEEDDLSSAIPLLQRTREIFIELMSALDTDEAPELSGNLQRLYLWGVRELIRASREGSKAPIEATLQMTRELHSAWVQVVEA
jgi:flagellar protein FliS